jgi:hypothetical protein
MLSLENADMTSELRVGYCSENFHDLGWDPDQTPTEFTVTGD